ncbi:MAG TPA: hypothetical protein VGT61_08645 [Thermomicrobiales bacterium]|jgi:hypothetical protein|nr:hypothetical protein [Thermomicrobiales bacterium]
MTDDAARTAAAHERDLKTINDLSVILGTARLVERRVELGRPVSDEQLRRDMRTIQDAVYRISARS